MYDSNSKTQCTTLIMLILSLLLFTTSHLYAGTISCQSNKNNNLDISIEIAEPAVTVIIDGERYNAETDFMQLSASLTADGNYEHYININLDNNIVEYTARSFGRDDAETVTLQGCKYHTVSAEEQLSD